MSDEIRQWLASEALRLGNEVRDLTKERDGLQEHIKYLEIELKCETGRWERTMEDNARLKAEVERLKMEESKLLTLCETYEGDLERLRKAGDALYESEIGYYGEQILVDPKHHSGELCRNWNAAKEGKQP